MIEHRAYPKIGRSGGAVGGAWVATEKIHGANLVLACDGETVRFARRKAWLADDDPFFGWQLLRGELAAAARHLHRAVDRPNAVVRIFGELFGGGYPHPDVAAVAGLAPVQTGVWYAPDLRFAAFDVAVDGPKSAAFAAHDDAVSLIEAAGLLAVPEIDRGTRADLERLPVRFATRVSSALGLPAIAGNVAEGIVIKPLGGGPIDERPALKRKIADFDDARFDESRPFDPEAHLGLDELRALAARMVNPARLASARSKVGAEPAQVIDEMVLDVLIDLASMLPRQLTDPAVEDALRSIVAELARAELARADS